MTLALLNVGLDEDPQFGPQSFPLRPLDLHQTDPEEEQEGQQGEAGPRHAGHPGEDCREDGQVGEGLAGQTDQQAGHHQGQEDVERGVVDVHPRHLHDVPLEAVPAVAVEDEEDLNRKEEGRTEDAQVEVR